MDYRRKKKTYIYEHGGTHGAPDKAEQMRKKILSALQGGASDKEIMLMVRDSGLQDEYEFNWDNVEMKVEVHKLPSKADRFGPKDAPGQRGDMFGKGGSTDSDTEKGKSAKELIREYQAILNRTGLPEETRKMYEAKIAKIRESEKAMDGMKTYSYEHGGTHGNPDDDVAKMKNQIVRMMEGGASDKEIMMMINSSPLGKQYEFNWDTVEMKVEAYPMQDQRNPREREIGKEVMEEGTQGSSKVENLLEKLMDEGRRGKDGIKTYRYEHGGSHGEPKTHAGQYEGFIMEDEGGKYGIYDYGDGRTVKTYFMEDPGAVGEYVPDNDYVFEEMDGKTFARLAEGFEDQRNPREGKMGKEVMQEGTQGASKIENLLEKLMDEGRRGKDGTKTYSY